MRFQLKKDYSHYFVFLAYVLSILWLAAAMAAFALDSGGSFDHIWLIFLFVVGVVIVFFTLVKIAARNHLTETLPQVSTELSGRRHAVLAVLVTIYALVPVLHFSTLGSVPILEAMQADTDLTASIIRQSSYFDLPRFMRYVSDYSLKALGPALLLIAYYFRSRLFWVVLIAGVLYSLGLFVRILPLLLLLPLLIFQVMQRRWAHAACTFVLMFCMVVVVTKAGIADSAIGNSQLAVIENSQLAEQRDDWRRTSALYALYERVLIVPGRVIEQWFQYYTRINPSFEDGCGYRLLAQAVGCEYKHIPSSLYSVYYPENVANGMHGSLNAAHFMTDFANFGYYGFMLSALYSGLFFVVATVIYKGHPLALPLNFSFIVTLMESNFFHALNSGSGWLLVTLLFLFFFTASHRHE